jgi:hypothetical protein
MDVCRSSNADVAKWLKFLICKEMGQLAYFAARFVPGLHVLDFVSQDQPPFPWISAGSGQ